MIRFIALKFCLLLFLPQILLGMTNSEFTDWWLGYRTNPQIPIELLEMEDYVVSNPTLQSSSNFWNGLNKWHIQQITELGFENFKQTVATNYFTWVVSLDNPYSYNLFKLVTNPTIGLIPEEFYRKYSFLTAEESIRYNTITFYFLNYIVNNIGAGSLLDQLEEPLIGNPPAVTYNGKRVSQDIFNSLLEYIPIAENCDLENIHTILEIGAGSGRTAFCFLTLHPNIKYVIADFTPALYISQTYLSMVFPDKKVMKFRPFVNFEEVEDEYNEADIVFIMPDQLAMIPDHSADLFLAIDCLHEMKTEQVVHYFKEADRLSKYFYYKCWQQTEVPWDNVKHTISSYPVKPTWKQLFLEPCVVPSTFFHAIYQMKD